MSFGTRFPRLLGPVLVMAGLVLPATPLPAQVKPPAEPAKIKLSVQPETVAPGAAAQLIVELQPVAGVKIARYPQVKLRVGGRGGLIEESQVTEGDPKPPPPDQLDSNYFEDLGPLRLTVQLDGKAPLGRHELEGDVTYAYCISGLCSRIKVPVKFPLLVATH